jgi:hypothetical protein
MWGRRIRGVKEMKWLKEVENLKAKSDKNKELSKIKSRRYRISLWDGFFTCSLLLNLVLFYFFLRIEEYLPFWKA